mmetsp:Transcript_120075/g.299532  ORF Transcript_120075/g.299532 Transcript_120075/m.299532 type:complete len:280 (-) Transcript_120075:815-1654(-)
MSWKKASILGLAHRGPRCWKSAARHRSTKCSRMTSRLLPGGGTGKTDPSTSSTSPSLETSSSSSSSEDSQSSSSISSLTSSSTSLPTSSTSSSLPTSTCELALLKTSRSSSSPSSVDGEPSGQGEGRGEPAGPGEGSGSGSSAGTTGAAMPIPTKGCLASFAATAPERATAALSSALTFPLASSSFLKPFASSSSSSSSSISPFTDMLPSSSDLTSESPSSSDLAFNLSLSSSSSFFALSRLSALVSGTTPIWSLCFSSSSMASPSFASVAESTNESSA